MNLEHLKGKFITFEGIEGVGKSTQVQKLKSLLNEHNIENVITREPGGTQIAEEIREILLRDHTEELTSETELLLLFAARAQHFAIVIKPALEAGKCVVCDRFTDASYAYQGGGRGISFSHIERLEDLVLGHLRPDVTLLLDAENIDLTINRARGVGSGDRIEQEQLDFFERVREAYLHRAKRNSRIKIINALQSIENTQQEINQVLSDSEIFN